MTEKCALHDHVEKMQENLEKKIEKEIEKVSHGLTEANRLIMETKIELKDEINIVRNKADANAKSIREWENDIIKLQETTEKQGYEIGLTQQQLGNIVKNTETVVGEVKNATDHLHTLDKQVVLLSFKIGAILFMLGFVASNLDLIIKWVRSWV